MWNIVRWGKRIFVQCNKKYIFSIYFHLCLSYNWYSWDRLMWATYISWYICVFLTIQIQYARSETHLIEQLDNMCEKMNSYAESTDPNTGKKSYIRTSSRSGEAVTLSNVAISGDIAQKLKHAVSYTCSYYLVTKNGQLNLHKCLLNDPILPTRSFPCYMQRIFHSRLDYQGFLSTIVFQ